MRLATLAALLTTLIAAPVLAQNIPVKSAEEFAEEFGRIRRHDTYTPEDRRLLLAAYELRQSRDIAAGRLDDDSPAV